MVYVILRTGKVLQYNNGDRISSGNGVINILSDAGASLVAVLPMDAVERAEFTHPCRVIVKGGSKRGCHEY